MDRATVTGRHILGVNNILDPNGHAADQSARDGGIDYSGIRERLFRIQIHPGVNLGLARFYTLEAFRRHPLAGHRPSLDHAGNFRRRQFP